MGPLRFASDILHISIAKIVCFRSIASQEPYLKISFGGLGFTPDYRRILLLSLGENLVLIYIDSITIVKITYDSFSANFIVQVFLLLPMCDK